MAIGRHANAVLCCRGVLNLLLLTRSLCLFSGSSGLRTQHSADTDRGHDNVAGNLNSNGQQLLVFGKQFGNVFIGVQPTFGYEGDPMRLLFSRSASPHHGFAAYYTYLEHVFKVGPVPLISFIRLNTGGGICFGGGSTWSTVGTCHMMSCGVIQADAVLHFGTHGSLEFMPGKQVSRITRSIGVRLELKHSVMPNKQAWLSEAMMRPRPAVMCVRTL